VAIALHDHGALRRSVHRVGTPLACSANRAGAKKKLKAAIPRRTAAAPKI
jgi:hypothetical protein